MNNILEIALEYANKNRAIRIRTVTLLIGDLSDVIPQWAQNYFDMLSKDTIADQAQLIIDRVPAVTRCNRCGNKNILNRDEYSFVCQKCGSTDTTLVSGKELQIKSIEID